MRQCFPDLADSDLPTDSFVIDEPMQFLSNSEVKRRADSKELIITRPEGFYEPQVIRDT